MGFENTNLKKLSVNSNKLVFLPRSLTLLTNLRVLDARLNCLLSLPEDMENLINLEVLNVSQNFHHLETLPFSIGLLMSLLELDVSYNKITTLPDSFGCLKKLQKLVVEGNPMVSPPYEVVEQGLHAVKEYLSEKMNGGHKSHNKKKSWVGKLVKYGAFNGGSNRSVVARDDREGTSRLRSTTPSTAFLCRQGIWGCSLPVVSSRRVITSVAKLKKKQRCLQNKHCQKNHKLLYVHA